MKTGFKLVIAIALVLSGCGGSSSSTSSSSSSSTSSASSAASAPSTHSAAGFKAAFESAANQLRLDARAIALEIQRAPAQTDAQAVSAFRGLAPRWQGHLNQLEALKPPPPPVAAALDKM